MAKSLSESLASLSIESPNGGANSNEMGVIGISFGNQYSTICTLVDGKITTIANEDGDRMIPVFVTFYGDGERMIGTQAKIQSVNKFKSTVTQFGHLLGATFDDESVMGSLTMSSLFPVKPVTPHLNDESVPSYSMELRTFDDESAQEKLTKIHVSARDLTTYYFEKLRQTVEGYFGAVRVAEDSNESQTPSTGGSLYKSCVVATPYNFTPKQRNALVASVKDSGFETVNLIDEHSAAVLSYVTKDATEHAPSEGNLSPRQVFLVVDLGSHSLKVSVVQFCVPQSHFHSFKAMQTHGLITVLSHVTSNEIGGFFFDKKLVNGYLADEFYRKTRMDVKESKKSMIKLTLAAESTKKALSSRDSAPCYVESLMDGVDFNVSVNRGRFEMLIEPLLMRVPGIITEALANASVPLGSVDQVLLVGGASRVPAFQKYVRQMFASEARLPVFRTEIEPDECIGQGCAIQGYLLQQVPSSQLDSVDTKQPHLTKPLALDVGNGRKPLIWFPAHTVLPARRKIDVAVNPQSAFALVKLVELDNGKAMPIFEVKIAVEERSPTISLMLTVEADGCMKLHASGESSAEKIWNLKLN